MTVCVNTQLNGIHQCLFRAVHVIIKQTQVSGVSDRC